VLYIDLAKVYRDAAHVVMTIHVCFKCIFLNVSSVPDEHCKCFVGMLHIYMHVASTYFKYFIRMFAIVSSGCCVCLQWFLNVFERFHKQWPSSRRSIRILHS
jgi:hypothetical protein